MAAVLAVLLVAVAGVVVAQHRLLSPRGAADAADVVRQVDAQIIRVDEVLVAAGGLVEKGVDAASSPSAASCLAQLPDASRSLSEAFTVFAENRGYLAAQAGEELAGAVETAVTRRQEMLACAQAVLAASSTAQSACADVKTVFDEMKAAGVAMADSATTTSNNSSAAAVAQALVYDKAAEEGLARARASMEGCASKLPAKSSGVTSLENYLSKQEAAAAALKSSDEALLRSDADAAAQHLNSYQAAADQARALEKSVPAGAEELVKNVYYSLGDGGLSVMDAESRYVQAGEEAEAADEKMDAFLSREEPAR